jgi:hypothetical protein
VARVTGWSAAGLGLAGALAACGYPAGATAEPTDGALPPDATVVWKVERAEHEEPKLPMLRLLVENRDFFRARLDALLLVADRRALDGSDLDPRFLRWREMLAEIRAARDSSAVAEGRIATHELLESVAGIEEIEREMDSMESLLAAQHARLTGLEEDFIGQQRTALVVVLSGMPRGGAPRTVVLEDPDGATYRIGLAEDARASLARGAAAELMHELVEPRSHRFLVSLAGDGWVSAQPVEIAIEPLRDHLTFLEIDASDYDPAAPGAVLPASTWTR